MSNNIDSIATLGTLEPSPWHGLVHEMFQEQARAAPDAVAIYFETRTLTYAELNARANRFARHLLEHGLSHGDRIAILMGRSEKLIIAILAAMKMGIAYVPIDLVTPDARVAYMLGDSRAMAVVTDEAFTARASSLASGSLPVLRVEDAPPAPDDYRDMERRVSMSSEVYCIYTSGSTGEPKGVMVSHLGLGNYVRWAAQAYVDANTRCFALYSSPSFDLTVTSIFVPLIAGLCLSVYQGGNDGASALAEALDDNRVDVIKLTPSHAAFLREAKLESSRIRTLIFGGEDLKAELACEVNRLFDGRAALYNEYGPTEAVVGCMVHRYDPAVDTHGSVPLGTSIDNVQVSVLDASLSPVPFGGTGEIYIGGAGVSFGYRNKPGHTARAFVPDRLTSGRTMYATGDLARIDGAGRIFYLGRNDLQVKLRGCRVDLGDVESALVSYGPVTECVVESTRYNAVGTPDTEIVFCTRCGIASTFPNTTYTEQGVCNHCLSFDNYRQVVDDYFETNEALEAKFIEIRAKAHSKYDCIVALSGGKDSTYALCRVVDMGMRVLAFTLDNGYISHEAKQNIDRVVAVLGVDHRYLTTPHMNEIFADSLRRHSNVCNGCFKTIYTFAINLSQETGVEYIVMGLSKGQLFETRIPALFRSRSFEEAAFERSVKEARKIYHRVDDAPGRLLESAHVRDGAVIDRVEFIDFYRYCDVDRVSMYTYIERRVGWRRPGDTGRSTNCLINDVGIYVHNKERHYHNYALPYSWDVRVGHIERDAAMRELDDSTDIDEDRVNEIIRDIGYEISGQAVAVEDVQLVAYYVADVDIPVAALSGYLATLLPTYMVPSRFVRLDQMPLTPNGKVNRKALPRDQRREVEPAGIRVAARNPLERELVDIWKDILGVDDVGIHDDFFALGGHSLPALMLLYRISSSHKRTISIQDFSKLPTINGLAELLMEDMA